MIDSNHSIEFLKNFGDYRNGSKSERRNLLPKASSILKVSKKSSY